MDGTHFFLPLFLGLCLAMKSPIVNVYPIEMWRSVFIGHLDLLSKEASILQYLYIWRQEWAEERLLNVLHTKKLNTFFHVFFFFEWCFSLHLCVDSRSGF